MADTTEEAKALLAEKPYIKGFKIFKRETFWVTGRSKVEFYIKRRRFLGWKCVRRPTGYKLRIAHIYYFDSEREARNWIEQNYPPTVKTQEIPF